MSSIDPKDIFTKISDIDARVRLAMDLVRLKGELLCKAPVSDEVMRLQGHRVNGIARLICIQSPGWSLPRDLPADVIVSFSIDTDKYFMNTSLLDVGGGYYELDFSKDIFHLQRRQSYRIRVPDTHKCTYEIGRLNGQARVVNGTVHDISSGGVRLVLPQNHPPVAVNEIAEGVLNLGQKTALPFKGEVRHLKQDPQSSKQIIGIEFTGMTPAQENRLFSITMELHRELFARWE